MMLSTNLQLSGLPHFDAIGRVQNGNNKGENW